MPDTAFILIVEDERPLGEAIAEGLRRSGHACHVVESAEDALQSVRARPPDVVITDYKLGDGMTGLDLLGRIRQISPATEVVLVTAHGDERLARDALREHGAYDYITKPVDLDRLRDIAGRAARQARTARENELMRQQLESMTSFEGIIAGSPRMQQVLDRVRRLARSKLTVLIVGESGSGKDLIARAIHNHSDRRTKPFLPVNCAGFAEGVLESELFGHVKGAFTGAVADRRGIFEEADGGTVFLDEVGDMPLTMQAKLLRALENGEIVRVGNSRPIHVDVRVVAATNKDLKERVESRQFRDDLFWRLNQTMITLPPLRDRREDIPALALHFLKSGAALHGKKVEGFDPEVVRLLTRYHWPGNVRELQSKVHEMVVLADEPIIDVDDILDPAIRGSTELVPIGAGVPAGLTLRDIERLAIQAALRQNKGNREKAAKQLGIPTRTLYRRLKEFGLTKDAEPAAPAEKSRILERTDRPA
ncbi:MAG: sigma-54-dependent Fis family transcriptional regulator [Phycisphaerae bacterium]|nr:sigma-54 dependent transcriptional regulator [Phycisphaerae bacterium]NUQ46962.1 sigma-54-dependent Fis family transcriptional regulator [Phycisphaerae bacterium]